MRGMLMYFFLVCLLMFVAIFFLFLFWFSDSYSISCEIVFTYSPLFVLVISIYLKGRSFTNSHLYSSPGGRNKSRIMCIFQEIWSLKLKCIISTGWFISYILLHTCDVLFY